MAEQLFYEDVEVGMEIPHLTKRPTTRQLVKWASAVTDWYELHYDKDFAQSQGLSGVIVHGWLPFSFMAQMITNWIGEWGTLKKIGCSYRGMNYPGEDIICKGKVAKKYVEGGGNLVECEIWAEKASGERTTPGNAVVALPSRAKQLQKGGFSNG